DLARAIALVVTHAVDVDGVGGVNRVDLEVHGCADVDAEGFRVALKRPIATETAEAIDWIEIPFRRQRSRQAVLRHDRIGAPWRIRFEPGLLPTVDDRVHGRSGCRGSYCRQ